MPDNRDQDMRALLGLAWLPVAYGELVQPAVVG